MCVQVKAAVQSRDQPETLVSNEFHYTFAFKQPVPQVCWRFGMTLGHLNTSCGDSSTRLCLTPTTTPWHSLIPSAAWQFWIKKGNTTSQGFYLTSLTEATAAHQRCNLLGAISFELFLVDSSEAILYMYSRNIESIEEQGCEYLPPLSIYSLSNYANHIPLEQAISTQLLS